MKNLIKILSLFILSSIFVFSQESSFNGKWKIIKSKGSDLDYFQTMTIDFSINKNDLTIVRFLGPKRKFEETMTIPINGKPKKIEIKDRTFFTKSVYGA